MQHFIDYDKGEWIMETLIELPGFTHQWLHSDNSEEEAHLPVETLYLPPRGHHW